MMLLAHIPQCETRFFGITRIAHESMVVRVFCMSFQMSFCNIPIYCCVNFLFIKEEIHVIAAILSIHKAIFHTAECGVEQVGLPEPLEGKLVALERGSTIWQTASLQIQAESQMDASQGFCPNLECPARAFCIVARGQDIAVACARKRSAPARGPCVPGCAKRKR
jgi:hypothetical protein